MSKLSPEQRKVLSEHQWDGDLETCDCYIEAKDYRQLTHDQWLDHIDSILAERECHEEK